MHKYYHAADWIHNFKFWIKCSNGWQSMMPVVLNSSRNSNQAASVSFLEQFYFCPFEFFIIAGMDWINARLTWSVRVKKLLKNLIDTMYALLHLLFVHACPHHCNALVLCHATFSTGLISAQLQEPIFQGDNWVHNLFSVAVFVVWWIIVAVRNVVSR